ncbi:hypothetical protein GHT06_000227 [Daphnia sinensis]|uniref:NADH dehydrogenase [ubiquinone] 1 beta subcomplex subunit 4 n=1 Tax=Daphnia sinensis TaxID=1820382 RepID=A0AAD5KF36_9CRUS|nr:hypothetical protein GHT06_006362 [Daphnia sinensis]KAI9550730.1 hypothetical protein GHT06_006124 [Daphnia sinensis]KAI9550811.1 hypothetical protein GHT06_006510 [Daphnia sinensis]KAI9550883.1 hypothetical protein GHT06_000227 [Daphnia sinensis]
MAEKAGTGIPVLPEAEAAAARAKLRNALKAEFRKQISHPYIHNEPGVIFDPAIQRFSSMKASNADFFRVTPKTTQYGLVPLVGLILGFAWIFQTKRNENEAKLRTGQVSYADRAFKFN